MNEMWILDEFDEIIYISDINTYELLYMNKKCRETFGVGKKNYVGKKCYNVLQGIDSPCSFCTNALLRNDIYYIWEYENIYLKKFFSIKDKKIDWYGHEARIEIAVDITEYKKELLKTETKLSSLVKSVPGGICQVAADSSYSILWYNEGFLNLIGYTEEQFQTELDGKAAYVHPDDLPQVSKVMEEVRETGQPAVTDMRIVRRDGSVLTLMTTMSFMETEEHTPVYYSVGIDITEYKQKEARDRDTLHKALVEAQQANASKSVFLSRMSHEIRTPLNAVLGMSALAGSSLDNKDVLRDCHKKIDSAANHLLSLLNDILDMSRIESGKLTLACRRFALSDFLSGIVNLFSLQAEHENIAFKATAEYFEEGIFYGDPLRLKQVVINLLSNALKFTSSGGEVSLHIRRLSRENDTAWLEMRVSDTGIGMKPEFLQRIFNMFEQEDSDTTSRYGGSGLGLAISKHIIELMGGTIAVRSTEGAGSCFDVAVPLAVHEENTAGMEDACISYMQSKHILVFCDSVCRNVYHILQDMHIAADYASSVEETRKILRRSMEDGNVYDVVIIDNALSCEDNIELIQYLSEIDSSNAMHIIMGIYNISTVAALTKKIRAASFLQKPVFRSTLLSAFQDVLHLKTPEQSAVRPAYDFTGKRILLVEDNDLNMEIAYEILKSCKFEVETANNGKSAIDMFYSRPEKYFDAILMDIRMPVMDGLTATKKIRLSERSDASAIPIIAVSANAFDEDQKKSRDSGMNAHISKPIDINMLYSVLARYIR